MTDTIKSASRQLVGVQYLRAIAALMVVYLHTQIQIPAFTPLLQGYFLGNAHLSNGVDLFFVISGFIMVVSSGRATPGEFVVKRLMRIVPLYWTLTTALTIIALWRPYLLRTTVVSVEYYVKSLLFIPYANPGQGGRLVPLLLPGWSLNLEMFFYVIFALVLFLPVRLRVIATSLAFITIVSCAPLFQQTVVGPEIGFFGDFKLFEFLFGMIIGQMYSQRLPSMPAPVSWAVTAAAVIVLLWGLPFIPLAPGWPKILFENAIPAAVLLVGMLSLENVLRHRPVGFWAFFGDASYSMYLSHLFMLGIVRFLWAKFGLDQASGPYAVTFALACVAFTLVGTCVVYLWLEKPMLRTVHNLYRWQWKSIPVG